MKIPNLKTLLKKPIVSGSIIVFLGNTIGNIFSYLYHFISGKYLSPSEYGLMQSLIALTYFLGVLISAFSFSIIKIANKIKNSQIPLLIKKVNKKSLKLSLFIWIISLLFYPLLNTQIKLNNFWIYFLFSLQILFSINSVIYSAIFQAKLKFLRQNINALIASSLKLLLLFILLFFNFKLFATTISYIVPGIILIILGNYYTNKYWPEKKPEKSILKLKTSDFIKYSGFSLVTNFALTSIITTDILLARKFLNQFDSGIYSATSVIGKSIFFLSGSISSVAFLIFNQDKAKKNKSNKKFYYSLTMLTLISLSAFAIFSIFPKFIINIFYSSSYHSASFYLPAFSIFILFYTLYSFICQFLLAQEKKRVLIIATAIALLQIILIHFYHQNILKIIRNSIFALTVGLILSLYFAIKVLKDNKKLKK